MSSLLNPVGGRGHLAEDTSPFTEQPPERFVNGTCMEHPEIGPQNSAIPLIRAIEVHGYTIREEDHITKLFCHCLLSFISLV